MSEPAEMALTLKIGRPAADEFAPFYGKYVSLVEGDDIMGSLDHQRRQSMMLLSGRDEKDGDFRYAPEKWSVKQVLGHLCDAERVFAYRALHIARGDSAPLERFEQEDYVRNGRFERRLLSDLVEDFIAVRRATISLLRNLDEAAWLCRGIVNKNSITVRALAYIIAGHELHHREILREKYFPAE